VKKLASEVTSSIRFLNLNKLQAFTLEREVVGASQREHSQNDCYVGHVSLLDDNLEDIFNFFIRQRLKVEECDLFISLSSNMDTNIVEVPSVVNQMLKFIDCKLTMSFTVLSDAK
jgi:hypothetical protein